MRRLGLLLIVVGLVAVVIGTASGCGTFFSFNGRHPVATQPLVLGTPVRQTFPAKAGLRYTLAVHVVFEREDLPVSNGMLVVEAQLPIVASLEDSSGVAVAKAVGFVDPNEPPNVLYGSEANPNERRPAGAGPRELVVERLVGSYSAPADRDVAYSVDLGPDRLGKARVKETRLVIYDDKLPTSITVAFAAAGAGALSFLAGAIMLFFSLFTARKSGGARRPQVV